MISLRAFCHVRVRPALRAGHSGRSVERVDVLDKVRILTLLPDGVPATTRTVADCFEVPLAAVKSLVKDHRSEPAGSGYRVPAGQELRAFKALSGLAPRTPWLGGLPPVGRAQCGAMSGRRGRTSRT
ncbi:hypothetical protein GCM10018781_32440 [Kitasatospora indigofera]|uniref:Uncharacterized protein n=1 Tax=Kitasatospora indigofera TaxID=67307 RepID=A0A919FTQ8_9ACTN|nr:hypothetical protein GCM10018781_32440 [Kitasatospora indigofera]